MKIDKLEAKRKKLDEQIRATRRREQERKERIVLSLAHKHGILKLDATTLSAVLDRCLKGIAPDDRGDADLRATEVAEEV